MDTTGDVASACGKRIVNAVDVLARHFDLRREPVGVETRIGDLGLGDNDCAILERYVGKERAAAGKSKLKSGTIKPTTTIRELIDHAC